MKDGEERNELTVGVGIMWANGRVPGRASCARTLSIRFPGAGGVTDGNPDQMPENRAGEAPPARVVVRLARCAMTTYTLTAGALERSVMTKKAKKVPFDAKVFLATTNGGRSISKYRTGKVIFAQGDPADAVFYIQKGQVKVTVISEHGKEAIVAVLGPDEFCGEGCLTGQLRRMATATAMTECEIMRLEKAAIIRVLHEEPAFSEMFVSHLLARTIRVEADLVDQLFNSSEKRLARTLLLLANFGKEGRPEPIVAKISQETLAEMIGTTRARVSFFMNKFRKLGLIDYNGHIEIHSSLLNVVLHDEPHISS
jgi:CRP/FNR family cyclic AMP-dependent transcriptional regulator